MPPWSTAAPGRYWRSSQSAAIGQTSRSRRRLSAKMSQRSKLCCELETASPSSEIPGDEVGPVALLLVIPRAWPGHREQQQQRDQVRLGKVDFGAQDALGDSQYAEVHDIEEEGDAAEHDERAQQHRNTLPCNDRQHGQRQEDACERLGKERQSRRILRERPETDARDARCGVGVPRAA